MIRVGASLVMCGSVLAACSLRPQGPGPVIMGGPMGTETGPFAPASIRIHPLTRLDWNSEGVVWIDFHLEPRDRWSDTVKTIGELEVMLFPQGSEGAVGVEPELTWRFDLSNLDRNKDLFDPATRTYHVPLGELPGWVRRMAGEGGASGQIRMRAALTVDGAVLDSEYLIRR